MFWKEANFKLNPTQIVSNLWVWYCQLQICHLVNLTLINLSLSIGVKWTWTKLSQVLCAWGLAINLTSLSCKLISAQTVYVNVQWTRVLPFEEKLLYTKGGEKKTQLPKVQQCAAVGLMKGFPDLPTTMITRNGMGGSDD